MRDAANRPVFDAGVFASLTEVIGAEPLGELALEAEAEIARRLDAIAALREAGVERMALAALAHDLAGLAGQIGLPALAEAARRLERAARWSDHDLSEPADAALGLRAPSLEALASAREALGA